MFDRKRKIEELAAAYEVLHNDYEAVIAAAKKMNDRAHLIGIERSGRVLKFTFARNGEITVIETYGTMTDDVAGWKRALLS